MIGYSKLIEMGQTLKMVKHTKIKTKKISNLRIKQLENYFYTLRNHALDYLDFTNRVEWDDFSMKDLYSRLDVLKKRVNTADNFALDYFCFTGRSNDFYNQFKKISDNIVINLRLEINNRNIDENY